MLLGVRHSYIISSDHISLSPFVSIVCFHVEYQFLNQCARPNGGGGRNKDHGENTKGMNFKFMLHHFRRGELSIPDSVLLNAAAFNITNVNLSDVAIVSL